VLDHISRHLAALGYGDDRVALDLSIARGLAYYTGPVFEAIVLDAQQFGSVFGGGRYDDLLMRFLGERIPATGASMGVDRLLAALVHMGKIDTRKVTARVLVTNIDSSLTSEYLAMTWELRRAGIATEFYLGTEKGVAKQLKYANQCDIQVALLYGSEEKAQGVVTVKNMAAVRERTLVDADRKQWLISRAGQIAVPRADLIAAVAGLLQELEDCE
jgi:histidyl-tRNA synthetase